jgi:hypothetical protein
VTSPRPSNGSKAADQGYTDAQEEPGGMHEFGLGVPRDYAERRSGLPRRGTTSASQKCMITS